MPDISMCSPERILEVCKDCYRRTAEPSMWQSYSRFKPDNDRECEYKISDNKLKGRGIK